MTPILQKTGSQTSIIQSKLYETKNIISVCYFCFGIGTTIFAERTLVIPDSFVTAANIYSYSTSLMTNTNMAHLSVIQEVIQMPSVSSSGMPYFATFFFFFHTAIETL